MTHKPKVVWGINASGHDASLAVGVMKQDPYYSIEFASQSERFSKKKNDPDLCQELIDYALDNFGPPDAIAWADHSKDKLLRQILSGQGPRLHNFPSLYMRQFGIKSHIVQYNHHYCHARYATSMVKDVTRKTNIAVIDSIGEWDTVTGWQFHQPGLSYNTKLEKLTKKFTYPDSIGLFYSAFTDRIGLKPNQEEYILMGMAAYGDAAKYRDQIFSEFIVEPQHWDFYGHMLKKNMHRGCRDWGPKYLTEQDRFDIAAAVQDIYEYVQYHLLHWLFEDSYTDRELILAGGCAMNCVANSGLAIPKNKTTSMLADSFKHTKVPLVTPCPGDAGNAIGAAMNLFEDWLLTPSHRIEHYRSMNPAMKPKQPSISATQKLLFTGHDINRDVKKFIYPVEQIIDYLLKDGIVGVAFGPAEFGPRALGYRSILADPRRADAKELVNKIKQREQFRPFGGMVLIEALDQYFYAPVKQDFQSNHMQYVLPVKQPNKIPALVHHDGTCRIQTVDENSNLSHLLIRWEEVSGCAVLLNTSLNIKGQPLVNDLNDVKQFEAQYGLRVLTAN